MWALATRQTTVENQHQHQDQGGVVPGGGGDNDTGAGGVTPPLSPEVVVWPTMHLPPWTRELLTGSHGRARNTRPDTNLQCNCVATRNMYVLTDSQR